MHSLVIRCRVIVGIRWQVRDADSHDRDRSWRRGVRQPRVVARSLRQAQDRLVDQRHDSLVVPDALSERQRPTAGTIREVSFYSFKPTCGEKLSMNRVMPAAGRLTRRQAAHENFR